MIDDKREGPWSARKAQKEEAPPCLFFFYVLPLFLTTFSHQPPSPKRPLGANRYFPGKYSPRASQVQCPSMSSFFEKNYCRLFRKSSAILGMIPNKTDPTTATSKTTTIPNGMFNFLSSLAGRKNICVITPK